MHFAIMLVFLMSCLSESFSSDLPEKGSKSFLSEVVFFSETFRSEGLRFKCRQGKEGLVRVN